MKDRQEFNKEIGKKLRKIRKKMDYSREEMSSRLNVALPSYKRMEIGMISITLDLAYMLCTEFEINLNWLITGRGSMEVDWEVRIAYRKMFDEIFDKLEFLLEEMRRSPSLLHQVMELYHRHMLKKHRRGGQIEDEQYEILQ